MFARLLPVALLLVACGVSVLDGTVAPVPTIASFTATPPVLPPDGGSTTLAWVVSDATALSLTPGPVDVTGYTGKFELLTATTTFTLTASSVVGLTAKTIIVPVGP
jgi:hypothetical protein